MLVFKLFLKKEQIIKESLKITLHFLNLWKEDQVSEIIWIIADLNLGLILIWGVTENILEMLNEKLCPKGKAYVARRKAAGEKHGAYLMGRAVKVCKGQMSGKKKK